MVHRRRVRIAALVAMSCWLVPQWTIGQIPVPEQFGMNVKIRPLVIAILQSDPDFDRAESCQLGLVNCNPTNLVTRTFGEPKFPIRT